MPVAQTFDLGRRSLARTTFFADLGGAARPRSARGGAGYFPEPAAIRVTLLDVCRAGVRNRTVTRLEFYPFTTVPIPRGFCHHALGEARRLRLVGELRWARHVPPRPGVKDSRERHQICCSAASG